MKKMVIYFKFAVSVFSGLVVGAIPVGLAFVIWNWCMNQLSFANEYIGLIKVAVTFLMLALVGLPAFAISCTIAALITVFVATLLT